MKKQISDPFKFLAKKLLFPVPSHLRKKQIKIDEEGFIEIGESIKNNFYSDWQAKYRLSKEAFENDLSAHLSRRLESDRCLVIPWLDKASSLEGKRILEIGCGTGSSAVSLAEQGAIVTGIDVNPGALAVARDRARVYGIEADFKAINADEISASFSAESFDMVIFFASLEHMTIAERLQSLHDAWDMLPKGGLLAIVETPNRLWYYDGHTSMLPFYHWLPNDLAFAYSKFSPRENFNDLYRDYTLESKQHFLRRGRGMSFHELEIAIRPVQDLKVISSFSSYASFRSKLKLTRKERKYRSLLRSFYPGIHQGFFDDTLYMIIEKD